MTRILIAGDTHANESHVAYLSRVAIEVEASTVIQLGDFGWWPRSRTTFDFANNVNNIALEEQQDWYWIDGNHEDFGSDLGKWVNQTAPVKVGTHLTYLPRGVALTFDGVKFLFIGGGASIDKAWRKEGLDWFSEELLTEDQVGRAISHGKVDVILSHDMPTCVFERQRDIAHWYISDYTGHQNREMVQRIVDATNPELFIHGHMHYKYTDFVKNTRYVGLHCDAAHLRSWIVLTVENGEVELS